MAAGSGDVQESEEVVSRARSVTIAASVGVFFAVVWFTFRLVSNFVLRARLYNLADDLEQILPPNDDQSPEDIQNGIAVFTPSLFSLLTFLVVSLVVPIVGIVGATLRDQNVNTLYMGGSGCCGCIHSCGACCWLFVVAPFIWSSLAWLPVWTAQMENCNMEVACPLNGPEEQVKDCIAASTWYDLYTRETDYGNPFQEKCPYIGAILCPHRHPYLYPNGFGTVDTDPTSSPTSGPVDPDANGSGTVDPDPNGSRRMSGEQAWDMPSRARALLARRPAPAVPRWMAVAAIAGSADVPLLARSVLGSGALVNATRLVPAAWRNEGALPRSLSSLDRSGPKEFSLEDEELEELFPPPPLPVGGVNLTQCTINEEAIRLGPLFVDWVTEMLPIARTLTVVTAILLVGLAIANLAGLILGSKLGDALKANARQAAWSAAGLAGQPAYAPAASYAARPLVGQPAYARPGGPLVGQPLVGQPLVGQPLVGQPAYAPATADASPGSAGQDVALLAATEDPVAGARPFGQY